MYIEMVGIGRFFQDLGINKQLLTYTNVHNHFLSFLGLNAVKRNRIGINTIEQYQETNTRQLNLFFCIDERGNNAKTIRKFFNNMSTDYEFSLNIRIDLIFCKYSYMIKRSTIVFLIIILSMIPLSVLRKYIKTF